MKNKWANASTKTKRKCRNKIHVTHFTGVNPNICVCVYNVHILKILQIFSHHYISFVCVCVYFWLMDFSFIVVDSVHLVFFTVCRLICLYLITFAPSLSEWVSGDRIVLRLLLSLSYHLLYYQKKIKLCECVYIANIYFITSLIEFASSTVFAKVFAVSCTASVYYCVFVFVYVNVCSVFAVSCSYSHVDRSAHMCVLCLE